MKRVDKVIPQNWGTNDKTKPVVSVVVPCYNVADKMKPFLESIIRQTYKNLEIIFVNDGSTDSTEDLIISYVTRFVALGMSVYYIYQENKGLGGAINTGLKLVTGKYLIWPDPDDWLSDNSVERKMNLLEKNPQYGIITSNAFFYRESDLEHPFTKERVKVDDEVLNPNQFELLLHYKSTFCSGCHMIRVSMMKMTNPKMDIFEARRGQNFQMLLPIYYKFPRMYLNECLYHYVVYENSMSRGDDTFEKCIFRADGLWDIINKTLERIDMPEDEKIRYVSEAREDDIVKRCLLGLKYNNIEYARTMFKQINNKKNISLIKRITISNNFLFNLYKTARKIKNIREKNEYLRSSL